MAFLRSRYGFVISIGEAQEEQCPASFMVRNYAPKNRYCRNTKLSEDEFVRVIEGYMTGRGAAAIGRDLGRSERAMRTLIDRIRLRIMNDDYLSGWMGGGKGVLPPEDDAVWPLIYDCMSSCPAEKDAYTSTSPAYVSQFRGFDPDGDQRQRALSFVRKKKVQDCRNCPINASFKFDITVREEWGKHELRTGGIPRTKFKPHYFEIMFRTNIRVKSTKYPHGVRHMSAQVVLDRLADAPL